MSRNRLRHISAATQNERTSLGDLHVDEAVGHLKQTALASVTAQCDYRHTREGTLSMLFHDTDMEKLRQVRGMVVPSSMVQNYVITPGVELSIDFTDALVPTITPKTLQFYSDRIPPLLHYIADVKAVHDRFEEVKGMLRWFNRNATPGAIRYYFPAAMALTPKSKAWDDLQNVPSRFNTPDGIHDWLQVIKDASATCAGAQLLPKDITPTPRGKLWLTFLSRRVELSDKSSYQTDQMVYNL